MLEPSTEDRERLAAVSLADDFPHNFYLAVLYAAPLLPALEALVAELPDEVKDILTRYRTTLDQAMQEAGIPWCSLRDA